MLALWAVVFGVLHASPVRAETDFLDPEKAFVFAAAMESPNRLAVHYQIAPDYYMYRERFEVQTPSPDARLGAPDLPKGIVKYDPTFEKELEVYHDGVTLLVPVEGGAAPLKVSITSQGCAEAGLCYPPMTHDLTLTPDGTGYRVEGQGSLGAMPAAWTAQAPGGTAATNAATAPRGSPFDLGDTGFAAYLASAGWMQVVGLSLLLGILLSFTPCVLPMVPILLALLTGDAKDGAGPVSRWRGLSLAAVYVLGMSIVYTALGAAAGLIGAGLAMWLQTPWVLALFAIILAVLALATFDVFTFQAPSGMQTALNARLSRIPGGRHGGVFLMGMLSALIVGPCVAAPLAGVLLFISQTGDLILGASSLFVLAWGEGLLLLVVGATSGALLPKAGMWMEGVRRVFGVLLLATAWWMVNSIIPSWVAMLGWAALAAWSAVMLGAFDAIPAGGGLLRYFNKAMGLLLGLWAGLLVAGLAMGGRDLLHPLSVLTDARQPAVVGSFAADAPRPANRPSFVQVASEQELDSLLATAGKPVMLDFYADWCVSCIEMERFTFSDPDVAAKMSNMVLAQADVTSNTAEHRALLKRFNLFGPPGILFFTADGKPIDEARTIGFRNAEQFGKILDVATSR